MSLLISHSSLAVSNGWRRIEEHEHQLLTIDSVFRLRGFSARHRSLDRRPSPQHAEAGEARHHLCYESRRLVRMILARLQTLSLTRCPFLSSAGATAMVKVSYLPNLSAKSDFTWALPPLLWWAAAEDGLTIVACSIPVLRPLFSMVLGTVTRSGTPDALSGPTYPSGKGSKSNRSNRVPEPLTELRTPFDGKNSTLIEMSPRDPTDHPFGDERSDKSILYDTEPGKEGGAKRWSRRQNGINCTTSVSVGYSNKE